MARCDRRSCLIAVIHTRSRTLVENCRKNTRLQAFEEFTWRVSSRRGDHDDQAGGRGQNHRSSHPCRLNGICLVERITRSNFHMSSCCRDQRKWSHVDGTRNTVSRTQAKSPFSRVCNHVCGCIDPSATGMKSGNKACDLTKATRFTCSLNHDHQVPCRIPSPLNSTRGTHSATQSRTEI